LQVTSQEVIAATQCLETLESELLESRLSVIVAESSNEKQCKQPFADSRRDSIQHLTSPEMFLPNNQRTHLPSVVDGIQEPMPKCLDAIRLLRDFCMHDVAARDQAGPAGAVQALLKHCRSAESTNRSKIMAVEVLSLLCEGHKANKKVFGETHGIQIFVSMLEFPASRNQTQHLDISNADTISAVSSGDSRSGREAWIQNKKTELLKTFPSSSVSFRIAPALRRALNRFGCIAPKGTTHAEACTRLALAMRDGVAERVLLQERAAQALWNLCRGASDQETFLRFVLGKAGGIGALMDLMEHSTDRAQEFAAAAMYCACEDNIANRFMFHEAGGLAALCHLLHVGSPGSKEHAVATLRVMLDTSRRSAKGCNVNGSLTSREREPGLTKAEDMAQRRPATSRPANVFNAGTGAEEVLRNQELTLSDAGLVGLCREVIGFGVLNSLVVLLQEGNSQSKLESAQAIRHMSLVCPDCSHSAEKCGIVEALTVLLGAEGSDLPGEAAAALHSIFLGCPSSVMALKELGGIVSLTRALTLPSVVTQERACAALLAAMEAYPPCALDMGEKGKECIRRLASADGGSSFKVKTTAERLLLLLRMILLSPGLSHAPSAPAPARQLCGGVKGKNVRLSLSKH
jgi:hypothetical protein